MPCDRHRHTCRELDDLRAYARRAATAGGGEASESVTRALAALRRVRSGLS